MKFISQFIIIIAFTFIGGTAPFLHSTPYPSQYIWYRIAVHLFDDEMDKSD